MTAWDAKNFAREHAEKHSCGAKKLRAAARSVAAEKLKIFGIFFQTAERCAHVFIGNVAGKFDKKTIFAR